MRSDFAMGSRLLEKRHSLRAGFQPIQIVCPGLHHPSAFRQVLSEIVGCADGIAFGVGELTFDDLVVPALFVQQRRGHAAEAMTGHLIFWVAHPAQGGEHCVLAHRACLRSGAGENITGSARSAGYRIVG